VLRSLYFLALSLSLFIDFVSIKCCNMVNFQASLNHKCQLFVHIYTQRKGIIARLTYLVLCFIFDFSATDQEIIFTDFFQQTFWQKRGVFALQCCWQKIKKITVIFLLAGNFRCLIRFWRLHLALLHFENFLPKNIGDFRSLQSLFSKWKYVQTLPYKVFL
jgi:hypothetical protein